MNLREIPYYMRKHLCSQVPPSECLLTTTGSASHQQYHFVQLYTLCELSREVTKNKVVF